MPMITFLVRDQNKNKNEGSHLLVSTVKCVCVDEDGVNQEQQKSTKKTQKKDQFGNNNNNIVSSAELPSISALVAEDKGGHRLVSGPGGRGQP